MSTPPKPLKPRAWRKNEWWERIPSEARVLLTTAAVYIHARRRLDELLQGDLLDVRRQNGSIDKTIDSVQEWQTKLSEAVTNYDRIDHT